MITTIYAGLLALLYVALTVYVIEGRYKYKIGLGDGGNPAMSRRIRIHGNFAEYVPLGVLLLFLVDYVQTTPFLVHVLGLMLLIGRIFHLWGICRSDRISLGRTAGMILTILMIIFCAIILIWKFIALRLAGF